MYINNRFIKYNEIFEKDNLCLNIKLKENRVENLFKILDHLKLNYKICNENKYYRVIELIQDKNYIIIDFVVESHVIIPQSFLKKFGYKSKHGYMIDYIDYKDGQIKTKNVKEYGAIYGYYDKYIEDKLSSDFEDKIGLVRKKLYEFSKENIQSMILLDRKIIMDFIDITTYRNPKTLEEFNKNSTTSALVGGYDHNFLLQEIMSGIFSNIYGDMGISFIINETKINFIINDSMLSSIIVDRGNEILILPISTKICIVLMEKEYLKKYMVNGDFYYIKISDKNEVENIDGSIYRTAVYNKENVIGDSMVLKKLTYINITH